MIKDICTVIRVKKIADSIFEMVLEGRIADEVENPGQFIHIRVTEGNAPLLRRPVSIAAVDKKNHRLTIIFRSGGQGTLLLSRKVPGETLDILGPLGNGFPVDKVDSGGTAILAGGGIGVPPLYGLGLKLREQGVKVISVLGFQTAESVFYQDEFASLGETYIATVDGTSGTKGFVTDVLNERGFEADILYTCGPLPMLRALEAGDYARETYLSMEERMGCGIGACFACVCRKKDDPNGHSYKKVCSDGPVFKAGEVLI
ncbi:dihydroorotate dehydrogenase electron transfer subunit [Mesobacillus zeae]|uniref:Dihydroorotate dehydrogenase B (NAD(+)), electron transfer subunit n=1 Tax=Mesobacillus zeae TaxID=1917180 RepID=A0A398BEW2_9BACI|nr:dihydroorotate dehydrogenase electron transfer subunit [Mesobacillus zeae]RID88144.1 dihydroorotate dehydrogenase electron transfer subunit [Mesobacillus zeae]